jgi:succinate dehydrogenase/fumarate reductase flavoprotein subunit
MAELREKEVFKHPSRRDFLKNAGLIAGGATLGSGALLAGCSSNAPAVESTSEDEISWDLEADIVVCGGGHCGGLPCAIEAARAGSEVIVLERNDWIGGLSRIGGDNFTMGGNNWLQQENGEVDDDEDWFNEERFSTQYRSVPELLRNLIKEGPTTCEWLRDLGLEFNLVNGVLRPPVKRGFVVKASPAYPGVRELPEGGTSDGAPAFTKLMVGELDKLGVQILLEHRMRSIYRQPGGPVIGVKVDTPEGSINVKARKAVHLSTGTWTDNYRMLKAWDPRAVGPDCYGDGGTPYNGKLYVDSSGDGHMAAAAIGAGFSDMSFASYYYLCFGARSYWAWDPPDFTDLDQEYCTMSIRDGLFRSTAQTPYGVLVKGDGTRFIDESHAGGKIIEAGTSGAHATAGEPGLGGMPENPEWMWPTTYLSLLQPRNVWVVGDSDGLIAMKWPKEAFENPNPQHYPLFDPSCIAIADSLEELASKMNMPADAFAATIERYNGFVDAGVDEDFGKPMPMFKIAAPPFYAAKVSLVRHTQRNGLRVNSKSQVLEMADQMDGYDGTQIDSFISIDEEKVIPHLYAAGEIGNCLGFRRTHNSVGHYITSSRLAGINAAQETSWEE